MTGSEQDGLAGVRGTINALGDLARNLAPSIDPDGSAPGGVPFPELAEQCMGQIEGADVLLLGADGPALASAFAAAGAKRVLVCDSRASGPRDGAELAGTIELRQFGWQDLDPAHDGSFDIVCCDRLLHRVLEPMALLAKLRTMLSPDGLLLISSMLLSDPERSEYLRFVPTSHAGDEDTWFIPGCLAFRWMVQTAGFEVEREFGEEEGPREGFPVVYSFLRARAVAVSTAADGDGSPAPHARRLDTISTDPNEL